MDEQEIIQQVSDVAGSSELEEFSPGELGGILMHVLYKNYDALPEQVVKALFIASACLMRDHCTEVGKDFNAIRDIYQRR